MLSIIMLVWDRMGVPQYPAGARDQETGLEVLTPVGVGEVYIMSIHKGQMDAINCTKWTMLFCFQNHQICYPVQVREPERQRAR